jgi:RNA polymerase sigma factor (sigma-70 family)
MKLPPAMRAPEVLAALAEYKRTGDIRVRNRVVAGCMRYVAKRAMHFGRNGRNLDDLNQAGHLGTIRACELFDPVRGIAFITYARWWIDAHIMQTMRGHVRMVALPNKRIVTRMGRAIADGHETIDDIVSATGLPNDIVAAMLPGMSGRDVQIDVFEQSGQTPASDDLAIASQVSERVTAALATLSESHREVIRSLYWDDVATQGGNKGYATVGRSRGVTRQRVQQIERSALGRLRKQLREVA